MGLLLPVRYGIVAVNHEETRNDDNVVHHVYIFEFRERIFDPSVAGLLSFQGKSSLTECSAFRSWIGSSAIVMN
jgi:hypothetical protein